MLALVAGRRDSPVVSADAHVADVAVARVHALPILARAPSLRAVRAPQELGIRGADRPEGPNDMPPGTDELALPGAGGVAQAPREPVAVHLVAQPEDHRGAISPDRSRPTPDVAV